MAYQVHANDASYEATSVFLLHLNFCDLKNEKIEEALNSRKK